jgi:Coenzyme PQQ synthesis protein D (PqqD)
VNATPLPLARTDQLLVMDVDGETLVYDLARHRAHCLNPMAARVWRLCDGQTSVERIAAAVADATGATVDEDVVWYAIRRLNGARLIDGLQSAAPARTVTRRDLLQRMTAAGLGMLLLPTVASIVAPTTLQAQASCLPAGEMCSRSMGPPCCPGLTCRGQPPGRDQGTCS